MGRRGGPGRRGYPAEFRRRVIDLLATGRKVADVARDLGISEQAIYGWRRQEQIDRGLEPGLRTEEQAELAAAKRRIRELEAELAVHRRAAELLKETSDPKGGSRPLACWRPKGMPPRSPVGCWASPSPATTHGGSGPARRERCGRHG